MNPNLCLLFDIDGTLVDTDRLHHEAFRELLRPFGRTLGEEEFRTRVVGQPNSSLMRWMFPDLDETTRRELADRKEALFRGSARSMTPLAGLRDVLGWAQSLDVAVAVVTNAPRANGEFMLQGLGLAHLLPRLVIGPELEQAKPHPLPYLTGLALLGGRADRAIAFEDSVVGVTSATGAGLFTVGVTTGRADAELIAAGAHLTVPNFDDPALWSVLRDAADGKELEHGARLRRAVP